MAQGFQHNIALWTRRDFDPEDHYGYEVDNDEVETAAYGFTFVDCVCKSICSCYRAPCRCRNPYCSCFNYLHYITQPLVIASDGGCRYNGKPNAFAAVGVYVGENSRFNVSELMPATSDFPTAQRAELTAALRALCTAMWIKQEGWLPGVTTLILKTDCSTLTDGMITGMLDWRNNDYLTRYGYPVLDRDLFWQLEEAVIRLKGQYGVETLFWWVPREENEDADELASAVLTQEDLRRRAVQAAQEAERHTKRKRSRDDAVRPGQPKRRRMQATPTAPIQWVQAPIMVPQPEYHYPLAMMPVLQPQAPQYQNLPTISAFAPLSVIPPPQLVPFAQPGYMVPSYVSSFGQTVAAFTSQVTATLRGFTQYH